MTRLALTQRVRASPYYPALVHPVFRRILPGAAAVLAGLLALTFVFYLLYGPLKVALPVHGVFQDASPPGTLAQVLAVRSSLLILAASGVLHGARVASAAGRRDEPAGLIAGPEDSCRDPR